MNEFRTKMIEREAKIIAKGMRQAGLLIDKSNYIEILNDLTEISEGEIQAGRPLLGWLFSEIPIG